MPLPPVSHATLRKTVVITALLGQTMLDSSPRLAILICGVALIAALLDGWWYLPDLKKSWWYSALLGLLGLTMWSEPRGWFFSAWALIEIGTGLRAQSIFRGWERARAMALAQERAEAERLAALGYEVAATAEEVPAADESEPEPPPPIPLWRYPIALGFGLVAAWIGAWGSRLFFTVTGWQLDLLAIGIGWLVGKAITTGAGDRSNKPLRWISGAISVLGVLYGRYLLLAYLIFEKRGTPPRPDLILGLALRYPGDFLGVWMLLFAAVSAWAGWRYARDPWPERRV